MKYLVRLHYGRVAMPCREFTSYQSARRFASTLRHASVRPIVRDTDVRDACILLAILTNGAAYFLIPWGQL